QAEVGENFRRMLADLGRLAAQFEIVLANFDRQSWNLGSRAVGKGDLDHAAAGIELRIVEQVAGLGDRRERNIDAVESFGKLGEGVPGDDVADQRPELRAGADAILVGLVRGILQKVAAVEMLAEAPPLPVAGQADENLLAVLGGEWLVDRP